MSLPVTPNALPPRNPGLTRPQNLIAGCVLLAVALVFPAFGEFWVVLAAGVMIAILLGFGLHIITGMTGMLNLGFMGCSALGAYLGAGLLKAIVVQLEAPGPEAWSHGLAAQTGFWVGLLAVAGASALLGLVLGYPTLKLSGDYFAIVTLAFSEIIILAIKNLAPLTGGTQGLREIPDVYFWPGLDYKLLRYHNHYVLLVFLLLIAAGVLALQFSRFGRALGALRDNRTAAEAAGINPVFYFTWASVLSSVVGGVAGYLAGVFWWDQLNFENFTFMESVLVVCYVVIGGLGSYRGAIVGTIGLASITGVLLWSFAEWNNSSWAKAWFSLPPELRYPLFGLMLIIGMRFMPNGLFGIMAKPKGKPVNTTGPTGRGSEASSAVPGTWPGEAPGA